MFGLYFLSPLYLAGLVAVAIPIFLHLFQRQRARVVFFSTTRFIRKSFERKARWLRIQDALLLLLRVLIFALIPLALAKPALRTQGAVPFLSRPTTAAVLVLDNSYSMGAVVEGTPAFERARTAARDVVATFAAGDQVAVYLVNSKLEGLIPELSLDLKAAQEALDSAMLSSSTTRYQTFLDKALEVLRPARATHREIFLFTDMQSSGWEGMEIAAHTLPPNTLLYLVDCGRDHLPNAAVTSLSLDPLPKVVGRPVKIFATVRNYSDGPFDTTIHLFVGDRVAAQKALTLGPRAEEKVQFDHVFPSVGRYPISATLLHDPLEADNRRFAELTIIPRVRILTVGGRASGLHTLGDTFYLDVALRPRTSRERPESQAIELQTVTAAELTAVRLADFQAVFLANVPGFTDNQLLALEEYVSLGGHLALFLGTQADPDQYNRQLAAARGDRESLLGGRFAAGVAGRVRVLRQLDLQHPLFLHLAREARDDLFQARFARAWDIRLEGQSGVAPVATFDDGTPAILEKQVGRGTVLLFNMSADREWSNLPLRPVFPVFVHQIVRYLNGAREVADEVQVGESVPLVSRLDSGKAPWLVRRPDGRTDTVLLRPEQGFLRGRYLAEGPPGIYVAERENEEAFSFVQNLDTAESDLQRADPARLRKQYGEKSVQVLTQSADLITALRRSREGVRLWPLVLGVVALLFLLENWLANRLSREQPASTRQAGAVPRQPAVTAPARAHRPDLCRSVSEGVGT